MEIDDFYEETEQDSLGKELLSKHPTKKTLMFAIHVHLNQFELHLDGIINKYKTLSLFWLLATYVGIGFVFSIDAKNIGMDPFITVTMICLFGIIGISSLWYIDIHTLHKFWGAFFVEGIRMENKHKFLLKIGSASLSLNAVNSRIRGHEDSYIFANLLLLISAGIALMLFAQSNTERIGTSILILLFAFFMIRTMRKVGQKLQTAIESLLLKKRNKT